MFFSKMGEYKAAGLYSPQHLLFIFTTVILIYVALRVSINKNVDVKKVIQNCTITMILLEIIMVCFKIIQYGFGAIESYVPLYFCSLLFYAGLLSSFAKGKLKRAGDVFLTTGGIFGGICYLLFPTTSIGEYPAFHIMTFQSFIYHGTMIYLGELIFLTNYIQLNKKDYLYYISLVGVFCLIAIIINPILDTNFMFISKDFPGTIVGTLYHTTGIFFTPVTVSILLIIPFYLIYFLRKTYDVKKLSKSHFV